MLTQLAVILFSRNRYQVRREMLLFRTEMRVPISLSSGKCIRESSCKRCYVIILPPHLSFYLSTQPLGAFSWMRFFFL